MLVECVRCGAPLSIKRKARRTKCRYCGAVEERARLRVTADETPKEFKPPKQWTPPASAAIDSKEPLRYSAPIGPLAVWGGSFALVAAAIGIPLLFESSIWNTRPATLEHASPVGARKDVAKRLGGKATDTAVTVALRSDRYAQVSIRYPDATDPMPSSITLELRHGQKPDAAARDVLSSRLNGGLDERDNWSWGAVHLSTSTSGLHGRVETGGDAKVRQRRVAAVWSLLVGAAFDPALEPLAGEMLDVMGAGYPVAWLAKVSPQTPIDRAKASVLGTFPGAIVESPRQMRLTVPLDHPLLRSVELEWFVVVGGTLAGAVFQPKPALAPALASFARCLEPTLGKPREVVDNPIDGTRSYTFFPGNGWLEVNGSLSLHAFGARNLPATIGADAWQRIVDALDKCRG